MKKILFVVVATLFLNGCFQVIALVGPAASGVATGNIYQSALSYSLSYGVKKSTGKTVIENVIELNKKYNKNAKIVNKVDDEYLISSFNPRIYPRTLKSKL